MRPAGWRHLKIAPSSRRNAQDSPSRRAEAGRAACGRIEDPCAALRRQEEDLSRAEPRAPLSDPGEVQAWMWALRSPEAQDDTLSTRPALHQQVADPLRHGRTQDERMHQGTWIELADIEGGAWGPRIRLKMPPPTVVGLVHGTPRTCAMLTSQPRPIHAGFWPGTDLLWKTYSSCD
jgi:hypothetical protein